MKAVTHRSTSAFAVGGVGYLRADNEFGNIDDTPIGGWRCFHCNEHFSHWRAARRHFGEPLHGREPDCIRQYRAALHAAILNY